MGCFFVIVVLGVMAFLAYASYEITANVYLKSQLRVPTDERVVALTFDDGPQAEQTPRVLEVLRRNNVKAMFFLVGNQAEKYPDIVKQIVTDGHAIGNHSLTHTWKFPLLSRSEMTENIAQCSQLLERIGGETILYFRPPFGVTNPTLAKALRKLNLTSVGWSIRSYDTKLSHEKVLMRIQRQLHNGAIILLHDRMARSEVLLQKLIDLIHHEGYEIVRFDNVKK